jgi:UPF0716 family protein affecting phage T7 exclusion
MPSGSARLTPGRLARLAAGWVLTITGVVLILLPVVPGFFLVLPGLAILSAESRWVRRLLRRVREQALMRRAMREAERAGFRIDLGPDEEGERRPPPEAPKGSAP